VNLPFDKGSPPTLPSSAAFPLPAASADRHASFSVCVLSGHSSVRGQRRAYSIAVANSSMIPARAVLAIRRPSSDNAASNPLSGSSGVARALWFTFPAAARCAVALT
jgi:hypothetical protein